MRPEWCRGRDLDGCHTELEVGRSSGTGPVVCRGPGIDGFYHYGAKLQQQGDALRMGAASGLRGCTHLKRGLDSAEAPYLYTAFTLPQVMVFVATDPEHPAGRAPISSPHGELRIAQGEAMSSLYRSASHSLR